MVVVKTYRYRIKGNTKALDAAAFFKVAGLELPAYLDELLFRNSVLPRYKKTFLFEPLDTWEDNGIRYGDLRTGQEVFKILRKIHPDCIIVPLAPPDIRADFVEVNL